METDGETLGLLEGEIDTEGETLGDLDGEIEGETLGESERILTPVEPNKVIILSNRFNTSSFHDMIQVY